MKSSALTGITEGTFDHVRVRNPKYTGPMTDIHTLVSNAEYDDSALAAVVAGNSSDISTNTANISTNTSDISLRRTIDDSYSKAQIEGLIYTGLNPVTNARELNFSSWGTSINVLSIKGGSMGIAMEDNSGNALADLDSSFVSFPPPVPFISETDAPKEVVKLG